MIKRIKVHEIIKKIQVFFMLGFIAGVCACEMPVEKKVTVEKATAKTGWTFLVYMAADNDLESYAIRNLKQLEKAAAEGVNVLVLLDRAEGYDETDGNWTDTRLFEVQKDETNSSAIKSRRLTCERLGLSEDTQTELDMANPAVLEGFIEYARENYQSENYALIIWGHGTGWRYRGNTVRAQGAENARVTENARSPEMVRAVAIDDRSGSYMSVKELAQAVRGKGLGVIGFDTCFGGVIENVYELKDCAQYTAACPGVTPSGGWDYKKLLETVSKGLSDGLPGGRKTDSEAAAQAMAQSAPVQTTVFVNRELASVFEAFEAFSKELSLTVTDFQSQKRVLDELCRGKTYSYTQNPCDIYADIFSMAQFYKTSEQQSLSKAAEKLEQKLLAATEDTEATGAAALQNQKPGLGVHLIPKSASGAMAAVHSLDYIKDENRTDQCAFIKESRWWVPTRNGQSGSLLDRIFYTSY